MTEAEAPLKKTIAVVGASSDREKFGNKCLRAYRQAGWSVIPVNPKGGTIEGLDVARSLAEIDIPLDRVSLYLPPRLTSQLLAQLPTDGSTEVFFNPGTSAPEILDRARDLGVNVHDACSIVDIGLSPAQFS